MNTRERQIDLAPTSSAQWLVVTRLLAGQALRSLLVVTGILIAVSLVLYGLGRQFGWRFIEATQDEVSVGVIADQDSVSMVVSAALIPLGLSLAAIVVVAVLVATRTRLLITVGLTRHAIPLGTAATMLLAAAGVLLVTAVVVALLGTSAAFELIGADRSEGATVVATGVSGLAVGLLGGVTVTVLFLRWPWWIGVLVLAGLSIGLSVVGSTVGLGEASPPEVSWTRFAVATILAFAYWAMMRRLAVR